MATKQDIEKIIGTMAHMPNSPLLNASKDIISGVMEDFYQILKDVELGLLQAAVLQYKREEKFFPTSSGILEKVFDIQMIASGMPTPTEAWAMVLEGVKEIRAIYCQESIRLYEELESITNELSVAKGDDWDKANKLHWNKRNEYWSHRDNCEECKNPNKVEDYKHPAVTEVVRLLGGRSAIITDNMMSDRARFIDAYREIVGREKKKFNMHPDTKLYLEEKIGSEVKKLSEGMRK